MVRTGFQRAFGADLRRILRAGTRNRFLAFGAGLTVTFVLQSSVATALLAGGFASRSLITGAAALAIMLGADLGSALIAQVLSLKLGSLSPVFILIGVVAFMTARRTRYKDLGRVAIGLGLMLLALGLILAAGEPMRQAEALMVVVGGLATEPILTILIAAMITWIAHSSLAIILLIVSLATAGAIPVIVGVWLVLGANLGGAIVPITSMLGQRAMARRVPFGNFVMRGTGVVLVVLFADFALPYLAVFDADPGRQIVNAHTAFNLALAVAFIGLVGPVAALCARLIPDSADATVPGQPRYLDETAVDEPAVALTAASREALRMGDVVEAMLIKSGDALWIDDRKILKEVVSMDDIVDQLHEELKLYLTRVSRAELDEDQSERCVQILNFATNLEHIGDIVDKNLMELADKKIRNRLHFSEEGRRELMEIHERAVSNLRLAFAIFLNDDLAMARRLLEEKSEFRKLERAAADNHHDRLRSGQAETVETSSLHLDVVRDLKRIHSHIAAVAYPILEREGHLQSTRLKDVSIAE